MTTAQLPNNPIFVALDTPNLDRAMALATSVRAHVGGIKLGLEFFSANGPRGVAAMAELGLPIFLDSKFHDIPNTVARAVRAVAGLGLTLLNVHAAGGPAMLHAAREAVEEVEPRPLLIGVTVLTSLDDNDLASIGHYNPTLALAERLGGLALDCGLDGVVCSPAEVTALRARCGANFALVVPGVRPGGSAAGDQKRVTTPVQALAAGADAIVIGRPITQAANPEKAVAAIAADLGFAG